MTRTIGSLNEALADVRQDALIYVDMKSPTGLSSWRGIYRDLAVECSGDDFEETKLDVLHESFGGYYPGHQRVEIKQPATVEEFRKALGLSIGEDFEGYKGGQYTMWPGTELWVSEYGEYRSEVIVGVEDLGDRVDLVVKDVG